VSSVPQSSDPVEPEPGDPRACEPEAVLDPTLESEPAGAAAADSELGSAPESEPTPEPAPGAKPESAASSGPLTRSGLWGTLDALVSDLVDTRQQIAVLQAHEADLLAQAVDVVIEREKDRRERGLRITHDLPLREISAELAAAMRLSDRSVQSRMGTASLLVQMFPETHTALAKGEIDQAHAHTIVDEGTLISDPDKRADYEHRALVAAASETPYRLSKIVKVLAARIDPDSVQAEIERSKEERFVQLIDLPHGRGRIVFEGPAVLAHAIYDRLTAAAHTLTRTTKKKTPAMATDTSAGDTGAGNAGDTVSSDADAATAVAGTADAGARGNDSAGGKAAGGEVTTGNPTCDTSTSDASTGDASTADASTGDANTGDTSTADTSTAGEDDADSGTADAGETDTAATDSAGEPWFTLITGPHADACTNDTPAADEDSDPRTMDQKRADILADILLTGAPTGHGDALDAIKATVQITIPALTILGHSKQPALLAGHGPIDLATAKHLAAGAPGWDRVLTHPSTGEPVAVDRYRPTAELKRFLHVRDEHCRFPGCTRPPWTCDQDHTIDAALGGPTSEENLGDSCRPHHIVKHHTLWRVKQLGHGILQWTSPTGRHYTDTPIGTLTFIPDPITTHTTEQPPF